ncbi:hypothetical protein PLCT2_00070 [Planctomycetaceae bacterium]|nr:hypothetical protein PLCT2_00070 [Planctomycetaceae bacterium]
MLRFIALFFVLCCSGSLFATFSYQVNPGGQLDINPTNQLWGGTGTYLRVIFNHTTVPGTSFGLMYKVAGAQVDVWGTAGQFAPSGSFNRISGSQGFRYVANGAAPLGSVESIPVTLSDGFSNNLAETIEITITNVPVPVITGQPIQNPQVNPGSPAQLTVTANVPTPPGTGTLTYQWYSGISPNASNPQVGSTSPTFTWNVPGGQALGQYFFWCKVTLVGNGFTASDTGTITVTNQQASVQDMNAQGSSPTNSTSVSWILNFSATGPIVGGLTASNFSLIKTGSISGESITTVVSGLGGTTPYSQWFITANTGSGDGTIQLRLANSTGATIGISGLPFNGGTVTIDKTRPTVSNITRQSTNPTSAASVIYLVTFTESVGTVAANNFSFNLSGVSGASVTGVSGTGTTRTVTVNTGSGSGTLRLDLTANLGNIQDSATNGMNTSFSGGEVYTIDKSAPTVSSIIRVGSTPTNAASVQFTVTFSESVTGVATGNFTLNAPGLTGASISSVSAGPGTTRTVTVSTGTGSGTLRLDLSSVTPAITDGVGNTLSATFNTGEVYSVDKAAPTVSSIVRVGSDPTNAASVQFTVTFSESVAGVATGNFSLTTTGVSAASVSSVSGAAAVYTVTVNTGTGDGTLRLDLSSTTPAITDSATNALTATFTGGEIYTIDKTAPTVTSIALVGASPTSAASVQYTVTFSESVTGAATGNFSLTTSGVTGTSITSVSAGTGTTRTVTVNTGSGDGSIRLDLSSATPSIADGAGNNLSVTFNTGPSYSLDRTGPSVSIGAPSVSSTVSGPVAYTVTYTDPNFASSTLASGNITPNLTGTVAVSSIVISGSGSTRTVTLSGITGDGTLGISIAAATATDTLGNAAPAAGPSTTCSVSSAPSVTSVAPDTGPLTGGQTVTLTGTNFTGATGVTFDGAPATGLSGVTATSLTCVTPSGTAGTASVVVTTTIGSSGANTLYTYQSLPTVSNVAPPSGPLAGGTSITITGTNLLGATGVTVGGTAATTVVVVSATSITCTTPLGTAGAASVLVTTLSGTNGANTLFTYVAAPTLANVAPAIGLIGGGTNVTLTGTDFTGATDVTFDGVPATSVVAVSDTSITCTTPSHAAGAVSVIVTAPGGSNAANTLFTYVTTIAPDMAVTRGVTPVADGGSPDTLGNISIGTVQTVTYTITNNGNATLTLNGAPDLVAISNLVNATPVTVTAQPGTTINAGLTTTFTISYTVTAAIAFSFDVSIDNDDAAHDPYTWTVNGTGVAAPEIGVARGATPVANAGTDTVGNANIGAATTYTYTISNTGTVALNITNPITIGGLSNCTATVTTAPPATVAILGSETFVITVTPTAGGAFGFTVSIVNDDSDENPYDWTVAGTAVVSGSGGNDDDDDKKCSSSEADNGWVMLLAAMSALGLVMRMRRRQA